jgi:hypothetical protein
LHLTSSGAGVPKINSTISAVRFFFNVTLDTGVFRDSTSAKSMACARKSGQKHQESARAGEVGLSAAGNVQLLSMYPARAPSSPPGWSRRTFTG